MGNLFRTVRTGSRSPCRVVALKLYSTVQGAYQQEKNRKRNAESVHLNFSQGDRMLWFLRTYFTEASKGGRSKIGAARGNQDPCPSLGSHTQLPLAPNRKELTPLLIFAYL